MLNQYAYTRTITLLDGEATGRDVYGNDTATYPETEVAGCVWWPSSTTEAEPIGNTTTTTRYGLLMPYGTTHSSGRRPSSVDRVRLAGEPGIWKVDGDPRHHENPITGAIGGLFAWLEKVTG